MERLNFPDVAKNNLFWEDYAKLDDVSDDALKKLFEKHSIELNTPNKKTTFFDQTQTASSYSISNKIKKSVDVLPKGLKDKFYDFIEDVNTKGIQDLYKNPGKWRLEKIGQNNTSTIRLNDGYRVEFRLESDGHINILDIGKHVTH